MRMRREDGPRDTPETHLRQDTQDLAVDVGRRRQKEHENASGFRQASWVNMGEVWNARTAQPWREETRGLVGHEGVSKRYAANGPTVEQGHRIGDPVRGPFGMKVINEFTCE